MSDFKPGDRVRYLDHKWIPATAEFGTVNRVDDAGSVYVNWDGEGVDLIPVDPITLAHVEK